MIRYRKGDATLPQAEPPWVIAHVVNDRGAWGRGFVLSISKRWPKPEKEYRSWYGFRGETVENPFELGNNLLTTLEPGKYVCSMLAQHGLRGSSNGIPLRYDELRQCLARLNYDVARLGATVHMPRIGSGLAGGDWKTVAKMIGEELQGVEVSVYDL